MYGFAKGVAILLLFSAQVRADSNIGRLDGFVPYQVGTMAQSATQNEARLPGCLPQDKISCGCVLRIDSYNGQEYQVEISKEALQDVDPPSRLDDSMKQLHDNEHNFRAIAHRKIEAGAKSPIRITTADLDGKIEPV